MDCEQDAMSWDGDWVDWVDWVDWDGPPSSGRSSDIYTGSEAQIKERQQQTVEKNIQKVRGPDPAGPGAHSKAITCFRGWNKHLPYSFVQIWTRRYVGGSSKV